MSFYRKLLGATGALICAFIPLQAVDFVVFTEPKTGTHLLLPILTMLTGKTVYWPEKYMKAPFVQENVEDDLSVSDLNSK
jgi:hypothetical protein